MEIGKYYIGLDVGTNSVGRAVTDQDFNLLRLKGKTAWGSRLFSDAKSAQERRQYRSNRRRMARRKFRVFLLNKLFSNELNKIDNGFLGRLELSALYNEHNNVSLLFNDKNKEKDFYNKYPTIYHLRYAMVNNEADAFSDLRYVYLALHHIIKYRGNFLTEGEINFNSIDDDLIERFNNVLLAFLEKENIESESLIDKEIVNKIIDILKSDEFKRAKQTLIKKTLNNNPTIKEFLSNQIDVFASLVSGGSLNFSKFGTEEKGTISLAKDYDEKIVILENCLDNDYLELIDICKNIYDHVYLENLLKDSKYLSESFVKLYEEHKEDKDALKSFLKQIDKKNGNNHYKSLVFNESGNENNYYKYITGTDSKCSLEEFDKFLIKNIFENQGFLDAFGQNPQFNELYKKAQNETLLKTISNTIGSEIPHQLHEIELMKILENSKKHFSFIEDIEDKIISIFKFKVEYYVGPSNTKSSYSNVVKFEGKEEEKVFPWNRKEIINIDASREKFMKVRLNSCTYLWGEEVLPKNSILLNDVFNLNVINTLKINGKNVDNKLKLEIFRFVNEKPKTTIKQLKTYLKCRYPEIYGTDDVAISGVNDTFSFVSPIRPAVGKYFNLDKTEVLDKLEEIIRILTIFGDSNNDAIKFIKENNAKFQLTDLQFACLKKLKCKDRGTLSRKLLLGLRSIDENGVALSIYDVLLQTNLNLQQAIFDKNYNFIDRINLTNDEFLKNNKNAIKEQIDETPAVIRRPIIQARRIVKEVTKIIGHSPEKICIEFTRTNKAEKKETTSRKKELEDFYKSLEKDIKKARSLDISNEQVDELKSELENISEEQILGEHLYLYFKQLGYDMYTGEKIDIKGIFDGTFDIDHIFPVSKGGENILDNKVLVNKKDNQRVKRDVYPLPDSIYFNEKVRKLWLFLRKKKID